MDMVFIVLKIKYNGCVGMTKIVLVGDLLPME